MITCSNCSDRIELSFIDDAGNVHQQGLVITDSQLIVPEDSSLCGECYEEGVRIRNNRECG